MRIAPKEPKVAVETLQENFLTGPGNDTPEECRKALKEDMVVVASEFPRLQNIIFRNQRDPGHPLEFHYSSKTHPFKQYKLIDGQPYQLPIEVIKNLEQCRENIEKYRRNSAGIPEVFVAGYKSHFVCERA